jgi:hypothetical protein
VTLAADPDAATHRAFGLPAIALIDDESATSWPLSATMRRLQAVGIIPTGELSEPQNVTAAMETLNKRDAFELVEADLQIVAAQGSQLAGHFLIDREGVIRWRQVEASEGIRHLSTFPSDEEILRAARAL